jgi:glyceraldehyde-3-phosphate dehydrogenase (NADP+)
MVGGLAHILTMEAYAKNLPPGTINFVSGTGRGTVGPIMRTGLVDILALIGSSKGADLIIREHPHPHRLNVFLQLEAKNLGIILPDADVTVAVDQVLSGSTSYNGQRCTAIKLTMVHESLAEDFLNQFIPKVAALKAGLPWEEGVAITPLPEGQKKIDFLKDLIDDAVSKGAKVVNADVGGGEIYGNLMKPAIVYPVTEDMKLWHEEQFGPVIPVAKFSNIETVYEYIRKMPYGQQAAIFTTNAESSSELLDILSTVVGKICINTACSRSPDIFPFTGRKSSALGTLSVEEALKSFSIEVVVAGKSNPVNDKIMMDYEGVSHFLHPL